MPKKSKTQNRLRKNTSRKNKQNTKKQSGGRVLMPIQYFGGQLNRYFPAGSPQLNTLPSAYGQTVARSFGTTDPTLLKLNATAPNLGPMGLGSRGENLSCGVQTGGGKKKTLRTRNQIKVRKNSYAKGVRNSKCRGKGPAVCRATQGCKYASKGKKRTFCRKSTNKVRNNR
jgi:hypothetical protein